MTGGGATCCLRHGFGVRVPRERGCRRKLDPPAIAPLYRGPVLSFLLLIACAPDISVSFDPPILGLEDPVQVRLDTSRSLASVEIQHHVIEGYSHYTDMESSAEGVWTATVRRDVLNGSWEYAHGCWGDSGGFRSTSDSGLADDAVGLQFLLNDRVEHREILAVDVSEGC